MMGRAKVAVTSTSTTADIAGKIISSLSALRTAALALASFQLLENRWNTLGPPVVHGRYPIAGPQRIWARGGMPARLGERDDAGGGRAAAHIAAGSVSSSREAGARTLSTLRNH